jgi:hypothetical protein
MNYIELTLNPLFGLYFGMERDAETGVGLKAIIGCEVLITTLSLKDPA